MSSKLQFHGAIVLSALTAGLAACGGDRKPEASGTQKAPAVAQATPAARPEAAPPEMVKTSNVTVPPSDRAVKASYADAEGAFRSGKYGEAAELFASYVEGKPENAFGHYMLGLSAWRSGDRDRAEDALSRAVEIDPENVKAKINLGRVLLEQGRARDALPHLEKAEALSPDGAGLWRVVGNVKAELGRGEEAIDAYRNALVSDEKDTWSMNNYGLLLIQLGRHEEALPALARAVELKPGSAVFQNNLGVALERSGYLGGAAKAFAAALEEDPSYQKATVSLERVKTRLNGSTGEAPDLTSLATSFIEDVKRWQESGTEHHDGC
jgi:tetratricopeptide (TPR) repeat protein